MERVSMSPGSPAMTVSTGNVILCSTSRGENPGASVFICTWTLVMSGTASMGRRWKLYTPNSANAIAPRRTNHLCSIENLIILSSISLSFNLHGLVKSLFSDGFVKSSRCKASRNEQRNIHHQVCEQRSDEGNTADGLFTKSSMFMGGPGLAYIRLKHKA